MKHVLASLKVLLIASVLFGCSKSEEAPVAGPHSETQTAQTKTAEETPLSIGEVRAKRAVVQELSREGRPQKIKITLTACLESEGKQKVTIESLGILRKKTADARTGCFSWDESVSFNYFTKERYFSRDLKITANGKTEELTVLLNPWQSANAAGAVLDPRHEDPSNGPDSKIDSKLVISGAVANAAGRKFEVDAHLNLTEIRKFRFEVRPLIKRMTHQGWQDETLGNGRYTLFVLVESPYDNTVLSAFEIPVEAEAGMVNTEIELPFDDLRTTFQRNRLIVELQPLRPVPGLLVNAYDGMFEPTSNGGWVRTKNSGRSIVKEVRSFQRKPHIKQSDAAKLFAERNKLYVPTEVEARRYDLGPSQFGGLARDPRNSYLLKKFCPWFFKDPRQARSCDRQPEKYFLHEKTSHIMKLHAEPRHLKSDLMGFAVSSGFALTHGRSNDETEGHNFKLIDASLGPKIANVFGISVGYTWYHTFSETKRHAKDTRVDGSMDKKLDVEELLFELDADVKDCVVLFPIQGSPAIGPMFVCDQAAERRTVYENYYYMYQNYFPGILLDTGANADERKWMVLIRGEHRFRSFVELMKDRTHYVTFKEGSPLPGKILNGSMDRYDGYFPGLLTQGR